METLEGLRRKLDTVGALHSIVRTMKTLAAVSIRQYERAVESLDVYNHTVEQGLQVVLRARGEAPPAVRLSSAPGLGAVVFGSDQGMCGQLNDRIAGHALEALRQATLPGRDDLYVTVVGTRVASRLEDAGLTVESVLAVPDSVDGIAAKVEDLLLLIEKWRGKRGLERVILCYSRHLGGASYRPETRFLLPIDRGWTERLAGRPWPTRVLPDFTEEPDLLLTALLREYLFVSIFTALAHTLASENASRLASMQGAERNIEERLADLVQRYHLRRQASITEELFDIIAGFEAL